MVGREALMTDGIHALANARLLTLTGPGGIGKTTVATAMVQWHADRELYRHGVFFVALEGVSDAARLAEALASALHVTLDPVNPWHTLQAALAQRECLLLLDNAEGLLDDATAAEASAVGALGKLAVTLPPSASDCRTAVGRGGNNSSATIARLTAKNARRAG
jgi:predicted ATPase